MISRCYRSSKIKIINDATSRVLEKHSVLDALFIVPVFLLVPVASITFSLLGSTGFSLNFVAEKKSFKFLYFLKLTKLISFYINIRF